MRQLFEGLLGREYPLRAGGIALEDDEFPDALLQRGHQRAEVPHHAHAVQEADRDDVEDVPLLLVGAGPVGKSVGDGQSDGALQRVIETPGTQESQWSFCLRGAAGP